MAYLFLLCAGSYANNSNTVLICASDPPAEAGFLFRVSAPSLPAHTIDGISTALAGW
jgi:hypothetical protein